MSLEKLCFILVERQKANKLRRLHLSRFYAAQKKLNSALNITKQRLKKEATAIQMELMTRNHESYRRVADLMNSQRPLLRELRKATGAKIEWSASNICKSVKVNDEVLDWKKIQELHNAYVFECAVITESGLDNPYAKELYGAKEVKRSEEAQPN